MLYNIFGSDMHSGIKCTLRKLTDDTKLCGGGVTDWKEGIMPPRGTLICLRDGLMQTSLTSEKQSAKSYTWVTAIPDTPMAGQRSD